MELLKIEEVNREKGTKLLRIARRSIEHKLKRINEIENLDVNDPILDKYGIAFVTLETDVGGNYELRGCIGYIEAVAPIKEVVSRAAIAAAFSDPRFDPLSESEMDKILIEITILTKPEPINALKREEIPSMISIGTDGLIIEKGITHAGLLLPQVPVEYCWESETFLAETCIKAGLMPDCWLDKSVSIKRFQGLIIRETSPGRGVEIVKPSEVKCKYLPKS
ncbi:TIGR00296 family protein [Metallosphaera sp.]|uniref:TIGR00296 family protein n=1 Tax=Metallosphaera sp. TaxID=2020860 RepID=UPI0038621CFE